LTAFFNLAEMALIASRASALERAKNVTAASKVLDLKRRPGQFLAAIRAGDLITDLLTGAFIVSWIEELIRTGLDLVPGVGGYASAIAGGSAFLVVSYLMLVFADLAPKSIALSAPERTAMLIASPLRLLIFIARPFLGALEGSNTLVLQILGIKPQSEEQVTQEEIRRVLSAGLSAGVLLSSERSMMERALDLDHRSVRTVMTGRKYIDVLAPDMDENKLRQAVLRSTASRLLVAEEGNLDRLVGIVSRADVLAGVAQGANFDLSTTVVPPAYVSDNASVLSVLETLKSVPVHMVIVVDEFGSVVGLATLADVLEAVAGDVTRPKGSAMEKEVSHLSQQADGSYLVSGNKPVDDVAEAIPLNAPTDRIYKTMAGLVIDRLRRIPYEGETIELPGLMIEVVSVQQGVVKMLKLVPKR
jgi:magnesium and cobalt exporter, CNNM family